MRKETHLQDWIKSHPHLNLSSVCKAAGVDKANVHRWLHKGKSLSQEHESKIMFELFEYGYKWFELPPEGKERGFTIIRSPIAEKIKVAIKRTPEEWIEARNETTDMESKQKWKEDLANDTSLTSLQKKLIVATN